ncbi:hypothetical protein D9756_001366 [Leucocoprinus leucothites]|uniref:CTLH domain-containing protein n=1 Tax=Leucocoprinus leucothites TaxID=201217 RepID=A0A8H5G4W1_9AGAR|nr:hypothetical protein D9756_001366 [Leucoagaricus leucothites]
MFEEICLACGKHLFDYGSAYCSDDCQGRDATSPSISSSSSALSSPHLGYANGADVPPLIPSALGSALRSIRRRDPHSVIQHQPTSPGWSGMSTDDDDYDDGASLAVRAEYTADASEPGPDGVSKQQLSYTYSNVPSALQYTRRPSGTNNHSTVPHVHRRMSSNSSPSGHVRGIPRSAPHPSHSSTEDDDAFSDLGLSSRDNADTEESDVPSEKGSDGGRVRLGADKTKRSRNRASLPAYFSLLQISSPRNEPRSSPVSSSSGRTVARASPPTPKLALSSRPAQVVDGHPPASIHATPRGRRRVPSYTLSWTLPQSPPPAHAHPPQQVIFVLYHNLLTYLLLDPPLLAADPEQARARKRQRLDPSLSSSHFLMHSSPGPSSIASSSIDSMPPPMNGRSANGNGLLASSSSATNGSSTVLMGNGTGNGVTKHGKAPAVAPVTLPGTLLYDDSFIDREELVRLTLQLLRDVGYIESAATLEAESGYDMESLQVSQFRRYILDGMWSKAEAILSRLFPDDDEGLYDARFLISQQKYLELLEAKKTTAALQVLRNELAPMNTETEQLHTLSSFLMCSDPEELRQRTGWDGASGSSRAQLLADLQYYIPPSIMIPQRRLATLLHQAREYQHSQCVYHNSPLESSTFSLYTDHHCNKSDFPNTTTTILQGHSDEVWNMQWSHDGTYLATCGRDKTAIIWKMGISAETGAVIQEWSTHHILRDHQYPVGCLAWSLDDSILLTSAEQHIKLWNAQTGVCIETLTEHSETVTSLAWFPDGSGFISGALDGRVIHWNADGKLHESWGLTQIRVTDLAITPDFTRLVTVGMDRNPSPTDLASSRPGANQPGSNGGDSNTGGGTTPASGVGGGGGGAGNHASGGGGSRSSNKMIIYDLATKLPEL